MKDMTGFENSTHGIAIAPYEGMDASALRSQTPAPSDTASAVVRTLRRQGVAAQPGCGAGTLPSAHGGDQNRIQGGVPMTSRTAAWLGSWIWTPGLPLVLTYLLLLCADGRLPSRRWRPIARLAGADLVL